MPSNLPKAPPARFQAPSQQVTAFREDLRLALGGLTPDPLIFIETQEVERLTREVRGLSADLGRSSAVLDAAAYYRSFAIDATEGPGTLIELFQKLKEGENCVLILPRFDLFLDDQRSPVDSPGGIGDPRALRLALAGSLESARNNRISLVVLVETAPGRTFAPPTELAGDTSQLQHPLPGPPELEAMVLDYVASRGLDWDLGSEGSWQAASALQGLTGRQAMRALRMAAHGRHAVDSQLLSRLAGAKRDILRGIQGLEYVPADLIQDMEVGGLQELMKWLRQRRGAFSQAAQDYGLPPLKGMLLVGIPGTGKSLTAKAAARIWGMPLVRLDAGSLFGSYVGESESRTRHALSTAESVAPCVLWIDEIEKGFGQGDRDGGTGLRVLGTVLTWMQEKTAPVFVVATANSLDLPPEMLRRGRFDEIFFLGLPHPGERRSIFKVQFSKHLRKAGLASECWEDPTLAGLAERTEGFVGAEIEQAVVDAMHLAFSETPDGIRDGRPNPVRAEHLLRAIGDIRPLSTAMAEAIGVMEAWQRQGRARSASGPWPGPGGA